MLITRVSPLTGISSCMVIEITYAQLQLWKKGHDLDDVCPDLTDEEKIYLDTGASLQEMCQRGITVKKCMVDKGYNL